MCLLLGFGCSVNYCCISFWSQHFQKWLWQRKRGQKGGGIKAFFSGLQHSCHPIAQTPTNWKARRFCPNDCNLRAIDDCVRPNDFACGTPLPKNSFDDGLHDSGFINPWALVIFEGYFMSFFKVVINPLATPSELRHPTYKREDKNCKVPIDSLLQLTQAFSSSPSLLTKETWQFGS